MRKTLTLYIFILWSISCFAQPEPCITDEMTPTCQEACIICDIDGYSGINNSTEQGVAPPGFCTTIWHNINWISFLAGSEDLTLEVAVSNCQIGLGLEVGIYESFDCQTFNLVSNCNTDIQNNSTGIFTNTVPLTIGQYYYFVMDGSNSDICNYEISVTNGTTEVLPLNNFPFIEGQITACPGQNLPYEVPFQVGATVYEWTIDDVFFSNDTAISVDWDEAGVFELCVRALNVCDTTDYTCTTVTVGQIPPTLISESICGGNCIEIADTTICDPGVYTFEYITQVNCDSVVQITIAEIPPDFSQQTYTICNGEVLVIGSDTISQAGLDTVFLQTTDLCDSVILVNLTTVPCQLEGTIQDVLLTCYGDSNGVLSFTMLDGVGPYTFTWQEVSDPTLSGTGTIIATMGTGTIPNLPQGIYNIVIQDANLNFEALVANVNEPPPFFADFTVSDFGGFNIACFQGTNGMITINASGGVPNYSYEWSTGGIAPMYNDLPAGTYTFFATDANGCQIQMDTFLTDPDPLVFYYDYMDPTCIPAASGSIWIDSVVGGIPPYTGRLSGETTTALQFESLLAGNYTLYALDSNDCSVEANIQLINPIFPELDLGEDFLMELGDSIQLGPVYNLPPDSIYWTEAIGLSCLNCEFPFIKPLGTTTYELNFLMDNGCFVSDEITISISKTRAIFFPNIFTPNDDEVNDEFVIFPSKEVDQILSFRIYSRWGSLMKEVSNFDARNDTHGWDGTFRGEKMPQGVYTWYAEVAFIDGKVEVVSGDVTLLR